MARPVAVGPGPSGVPGTVNSGAVVSAADFFPDPAAPDNCSGAFNVSTCGPDVTAYIASHELGHWLGLYHVSERHGTLFDPLSDTPTCICESCAPSNQQSSCESANPSGTPIDVTSGMCSSGMATCGGADNLMFWVFTASSVGNLSPQQGAVMRQNPALH